MLKRNSKNPILQTATCAALIAASLTVPVSAEAISSIERYCTSSWRQAGIPINEWEDCTQDTMLELLSRMPQQKLVEAIENPKSSERRELMRSVWCVAQRWRRSARRAPVSLDILPERETESEAEVPGDPEALTLAIARLSDTQREILALWMNGDSVKEISARLNIPAARVSDQKYKAIRSLKKEFVAAAAIT